MGNNYAYIDASNLRFGILQNNWEIDYKSFRSWLRDKFGIQKAILFIGFISENIDIYNHLKSIGYDIVFRPTLKNKYGETKGNVDGELILQIAKDFYEQKLKSVILVSGDDDYCCIVEFLKDKKIPITIVSPNKKYLSLLLKRTNVPIVILEDMKNKLQKKPKMKKPPDRP